MQFANKNRWRRTTVPPYTNGLGTTIRPGPETPAATLTCNRASNSCLHPSPQLSVRAEAVHHLVVPVGYLPAVHFSLAVPVVYSLLVFCLPPTVLVDCLLPVFRPLLTIPAVLLHGFHHLTDPAEQVQRLVESQWLADD